MAERFAQVAADPPGYLRRWKESTGGRVVGCLPMHVPEELLHAAGFLPAVILETEETVTLGESWVHSFFCEWGRSFVDGVLKGRYSFLDGMVNVDTCHTVRGTSLIARRHAALPFFHSLFLPATLEPRCREFLLERLRRLKVELERAAGREVAEDALRESIRVYNGARSLLLRLYELRRNKPGVIRASRVQEVLIGAMTMPKEEFSRDRAGLVESLEAAPAPGDDRVRVMLSGSLCCSPPPSLLDLIEDTGAVVVDDDLYVGSRYFTPQAREEGDPLEALAERYLDMVPCPTRFNIRDLGDYVVERAKQSRAQGVISIVVKFCEPHAIYLPHIQSKLNRAGFPHLIIETVPEMGSLAPVKTRLEAFLETVRKEV